MSIGIFAVLDDIAMLMDDVAVVTKNAAIKTSGILGDDLAVGAEKASGFSASRELPVLWKITKGSFKNKLIIIPFVFILMFFAPSLINYILIGGGLYLAYEGSEKIIEYIEHKYSKKEICSKTGETNCKPKKELSEDEKVKSAIITDFILSIEIIVITLSTVLDQTLMIQIIAVVLVAIFATVGVYGVVALLVRMDDVGIHLIETSNGNKFKENVGHKLVAALPKTIKALAVIGTVAMLMVAGGIFTHNIHFIHELYIHTFNEFFLFDIVLGFIVGSFVFLFVELFEKIKHFLPKNNISNK